MNNTTPRLMIILLTLLQAHCLRSAEAREVFNTHALEIDNPDQPVVDLSTFAESDGQLPGTYRVTVYVNSEKQGEAQDIAFVAGPDKKLTAQITPAMLKAWGVKTDVFPALAALPPDKPLNDIGRYIPMAATDLRFSKLQLNVSIPQAAMNASARGWVDPSEWDEGVPAALLNYNLSGSNTWRDGENGSDDNYYANLQSGINLGAWRLRNYSTWNYDEDSGSHWDSVNTYLQRDIQRLKGQLTLGDSYTPSDIFDSVQFRGAQLASDDNMLPDSLRGFAPIIRGIAQSSAQVTIKQNGYIIYQSYVAPGAFTISDLYPTSGSGDLEVTIKEADGSERTFVQPFSAVPIMQREGRLKYALTAGKYRSGNDDSDEPEFGQVTAIYGLPHAITIYGGTLYSEDYQSGAVGLGFGLGELGSLSADITAAHTTLNNDDSHNGQSYRVQYSKDFQTTDTSFTLAAYRYSTAGFYTFQEANDLRADSDDGWRMTYNKRQRLQLDLSQSIGSYGSFFVSGYQQDYWQEEGYERTLSIGWNGNIDGISYSVTYSYSDYPESTQPADQQLAFNVQVPLSRFMPNAWASYSVNTAKHGDTRQQVGLNGTTLADNNLSYSLQQSYTNHGVGGSGNISADYKGGQGEITGGYNYDDDTQQVNYGLRGGIVAHPHGITLSQPLGQSLAIIKAPGAVDTKVQNNTGVYTDGRGYAVVPYVNPYKKNRIALDTSTLGDEVDIDTAVQTVTPTQGAVVMADFNTRVGRRVLMMLYYRGLPVPFGAQAKLKEGGSGIVGDDGQVYLTGVPDEGDIAVSWNGGQQCVVHYQLPESAGNVPVVEIAQECRE
ncbi:fimbrial biogenesis outer membrane usher protein [Salmonella enterica]|uniref:Fimbria/pilus outer membrane usher protein n=1 Tax=Salmonella enterica TaxID=28901 RepID=A0A633Q274_SALER|nr:fimbrial biogenesis outer membrane usher protein [Salmonella enterica]EBD1259797.1 fimbrial biogenesis outer membrane usher protein [Salmonella enterica subsp. arizonae serovar 62:z4,z32:-]EJU7776780.1 fimbrial biogenesis outer membrane usher protein [Salmonella enterica subsp. arizonae serovar 6,7:g,z51:-]HCM1876399.1 fimbrial biogenesis outer membrane usher protein [Salmonella enterica subsp. arizonae serovar 63:z4,z23:-]EAV0573395.1 fimbrial biogenesis outer membrane usher protein [Salmon